MRKSLTLAFALLFAVSMQAADPTVDDILAKNIEAKGGLEKLRAVSSIQFSGKISFGGMQAPFTMIKKRPQKMKLDFTFQGMTGSQAYDGTTGWMVRPFMGKKDPEEISGDLLRQAKEEADFDGPFIDYAKKGHKVELLGTADVEGTKAYKVKLTTKDGGESVVYFDADSFLDIRIEAKRKVQGQEMESETTLGDYQEVDGLLFPFSIEIKQKGAPAGQTLTIEKVAINPAIDDATFAMPAKPAPAAVKQ